MKKKLSILIYSLAGGGAEKVVSILVNNIQYEYEIELFLMNDTIVFDIPINIKIKYLENSMPTESGIMKLIKLPLLAFRYKKLSNSDISLSFMNRGNYINIIAKLFGMKSKTIVNERSMPSLQHKDGLQGIINRFLIKKLYKRADAVISNSYGNADDLLQNFYVQNVKIVNNPFDILKIEELSSENVDFDFSKFTFITVGRLDKGKNHRVLIDAIKDIDAQLIIIGDGELKNQLYEYIKELKLSHKVFLLGFNKNPYKYLSKSNVFVFSSLHEGFPNVLVEALACNLPIISTDCKSGPREILSASGKLSLNLNSIEMVDYGILTPLNDVYSLKKAMKVMMDNEVVYNKYKNIVKLRAREFNKVSIINKYKEVINKTCVE